MILLDEVADDAKLDAGQRLEEKLESVDYHVWLCPTCQASLVIPHNAWFSQYSTCSACNRRTLKRDAETQIPASTVNPGLQEITELCLNCRWTRTYTRVIPQIVISSSTSSSDSSFSSGGGGGGGGGSFGGGSAGGGGAGGHY
jgi:uncharacterized protein